MHQPAAMPLQEPIREEKLASQNLQFSLEKKKKKKSKSTRLYHVPTHFLFPLLNSNERKQDKVYQLCTERIRDFILAKHTENNKNTDGFRTASETP